MKAVEPDIRGAVTIRQQLDKHREDVSCASCHVKMDPPGFALESYDVIGGWRTTYRTQGKGEPVLDLLTHKSREYRLGSPVDAAGELADGRTFAGIDAYKKLLLGQQEAVANGGAESLVPRVTVDDGADLQITAHQLGGELLDGLIGGTEETTTGLVRLRRLEHEGALRCPVLAVNEARTERALNDRHGTGQSALDRATLLR